jgi:hypothetical protein
VIVPEYTPGEWVAVVTDGGVALLPPGTDGPTVGRLWASMRSDTTGTALVRHLQELTRDGLTSLPPFALVSVGAGRLHAVVRGEVQVDVTVADGARVLTAPDVSTWSEQVVEDVLAVTVRAPGAGVAADGVSFPLLSGVALVSAVRVVLRAAEARDEGSVPVGEPVGAPVQPLVTEPPADLQAVHAPADPARQPVLVPAHDPARPDAGLVLAPAAPALASVTRSEVPSPAVPAASPVEADLFDHTLLRPTHAAAAAAPGAHVAVPSVGLLPQPAAVSSQLLESEQLASELPAPELLVEGSADHDGTTVLSSDVVALRRRLPDWAGHSVLASGTSVAAPAVPAPGRAAARLAMSSGERVPLNRPVLVGRAPQASRVHSTQVPRLLTVPSPLQDISRTHAEIRMDGDDVVLTDLHSTNGVLVVRCDSGPQRLQPGEATVLQPGVLVDLGEGITFTVERGA